MVLSLAGIRDFALLYPNWLWITPSFLFLRTWSTQGLRFHIHLLYRVIKKDGLNFVILYFKIRTSDKYDVNYILLYSQ